MAKERLEVNWVEWDGIGYTGYGGRGRIHRSQKPCENDLPAIPDIDLANSSLNIQSKSLNGPYDPVLRYN
jgi:hypothetical protein